MNTTLETFQFQAETKQLLDIMIHSLYSNKEIFLRELVSNASDALDRFRFEALTNPDLLNTEDKLEIRLETDPAARTMTISDNGIGMSREEIISHIGTIAKSGTRELRERLQECQSSTGVAELIGQFGVGFYSSFMVADHVTLISRRAGQETATQWESSGDGYYTITETDKVGRGTSITLHLKPLDAETDREDYTDPWVLRRIINRYSDFVTYPIICKEVHEEPESDADGKPKANGKTILVMEDKVLNSMKPIWTRPTSEVTEAEYADFYKYISHDSAAPLKTIALKAEGRLEYQALLFTPSKAPFDLYYYASDVSIRLYTKRVMVMEGCADLLPKYLRFIKGVVDSADLPLNISRQMLQQDRHITQIRKWLTRKLLEALQEMFENEYEKYLTFWHEFGRALKEGIGSDYENKDKLLSLLLLESSQDSEKLTTLQDYVARMKLEQSEIYYLTGTSRRMVENSPHLETLKDKNYEVLYLVDPVDELWIQSATEFKGKKLKSVGKGTMEYGSQEERGHLEKELKAKEKEFQGVLDFLQKKHDAFLKQVRFSNRLTTSPACLVGNDYDYSPQVERLLLKGKGGGPKQRRIMELNPKHPILTKMLERIQQDKEDPLLSDCADLLLSYALIAEGSELTDSVQFNRVIADLMVRAL